MAVQWAIRQEEGMGLAYNEDIYEVVELCCELLTLVQNAFTSESRGEGSIMAYTRICKCASRLQNAAEKRRDTIALSELEHILVQDKDVLRRRVDDIAGRSPLAITPASEWSEERAY
jgi:hypothetical protein